MVKNIFAFVMALSATIAATLGPVELAPEGLDLEPFKQQYAEYLATAQVVDSKNRFSYDWDGASTYQSTLQVGPSSSPDRPPVRSRNWIGRRPRRWPRSS